MTEANSNVMYDTEKYEVVRIGDALDEDGKTRREGYGVRNKDTGIVEHSTTMLPGAIFQCQYFNDSLVNLLKPRDEEPEAESDVSEDVVLN